MSSQKISFKNDRNLKLAGIIDGQGEIGIILVAHFTGFKEFKHLYSLAQKIAGAGMQALRFDFSDCVGESEGACEDMEVSHQVRDVLSAIDFMEGRGVKKIGVFGHSLGGLTAITAAANDPRVKALVAAAAPANLDWDTLFTSKAEEWKKQGYITFPTWKKGEIKIKYGFYKDLEKYDAAELVKTFKIPILVIHPGKDELVSMRNAQGIYDNANQPKELKIIEGSNHLFSQEEHEQQLVNLTVEWFKKWLTTF